MAFAVHFDFQQNQNGWRETWYVGQGTLITTIRLSAFGVAVARRACLGLGCFLTRITVQDLSKNDSTLIDAPLTGALPAFVQNVDTPFQSILVRVTSGGRQFARQTWFRGIDDRQITWGPDGAPQLGGDLEDAIVKFINTAAAANFGFAVISRNRLLNPRKPITGLATDGTGLPIIECVAHGFRVADEVTISRVQGRNIKQAPPGARASTASGRW